MNSTTQLPDTALDEPSRGLATTRPGPLSLLVLSAWCGLVSGLLEVGVVLLRKQVLEPNKFYGMSRHFVWMIPLINLGIFLAAGLLLCLVVLGHRRRGRWVAARGLAALTL